MESFSQVWDSVCQYCRETGNLSDIAYSTWVECIKPVSLDFGTGVITLQVPTDFHRNLLIKSYNELFLKSFSNETLFEKDVIYLGGGVGFASKTVTHPLLKDNPKRIQVVSEVVNNTLSKKA